MPIIRRTRGAVLLSQTGLEERLIAGRVGVARSAVGHWITGRSKPRDEHRLLIRSAYGIPLEAWTEAPRAGDGAAAGAPGGAVLGSPDVVAA
jgi:transcriptional regulator with XRE-family HTH domain